MKTKIHFITVCLLFPIILFAQEGTSYLPVFNQNETMYYFIHGAGATDTPLCSEIRCILFSRDQEDALLFHAMNHSIYKDESHFVPPWETGDTVHFSYPFEYSQIKVSEDNSKLWGIEEDEEVLLMDLNLQVGDIFLWKSSYFNPKDENMTVTNVYEENGRKIIEFDKKIDVTLRSVSSENYLHELIPVRFIEGVGCNFWTGYLFATEGDITADYEISDIKEVYNSCYELYHNLYSSIVDREVVSFAILPSLSKNSISIRFPEQVLQVNSRLQVFDSTGKLVKSVVIDENPQKIEIGKWSQGVYFLVLESTGSKGFIKYIKP